MFDKIDTIRFKNYKSFTGSAFVELDFSKPVNVFIGKNNTGTYGKEVENYLTARSINEAYNSQLTNDIGRYEIISDYLKGIRNDFSFIKVPFARKVAPHITKADFRDDLEEKIRELATKIKKWNE